MSRVARTQSKENCVKYELGNAICPVCNKSFVRRNRNTQTCSKECGGIVVWEKRKDEKLPTFDLNCFYCNQPITVNLSRYSKSTTKTFFCSVKHANLYQGRNKDEYTCKTCGKTFRRSPCWKNYNEQKYCSNACTLASPELKRRLIEMNLMQQKLKTNKVEEAGYSLLDQMGLLYFRQYLIADKFCVDAFFYSASSVIQFDGDYWHGNPDKFPALDERQKRRVRLDKSQDAYMTKCGYKVLRIWETDIKKHPEQTKQRILAALSRR